MRSDHLYIGNNRESIVNMPKHTNFLNNRAQ